MRARLAAPSLLLLAACFDPPPVDEGETGSSGTEEGADASSTGSASSTSSSPASSTTGAMPDSSSGDPDFPDVGETGWDGSTTSPGESSSDGDGSSTGCDHPDCDVDCEGVVDGDAALDACGVCDSSPTNDCIPNFAADGTWNCSVGESCQDVYQIAAFAGSTTTISVSNVTGGSVVRTAAFAPGIPLDGPNLLTGQQLDWLCSSTFAVAQFYASETGVYRIAIGRDANLSSGQSGSYSLDIAATPGLVPGGLSVDDLPSEAQGTYCEI